MEIKSYSEIDELLRLTEDMFSLASSGSWDEVEACEAQRIAAIESLTPSKNETDQTTAAKISRILDTNAEIVALALNEKIKIADELSLSRRLEKAEKAYRDIDV